MTHYYLAIDAGTGSGRAVVFDDTGAQVSVGQQEWSHRAENGVPGSMAFDCVQNWDILCGCIKAAVAQAGIRASEIAAVSSTSMREAIVLYDAESHEIWACANVDGRAGGEVAALKAREAGLERRFYEKSGQTFALGAWPRLEWVRRNRPELWERVARISMINDWIAFRLSGEITAEPSNAGTTGLMDLAARDWSDALIEAAGLPRGLFPPVVASGESIGRLTAKAAAETGLTEGTLVVAGGGDVQMGSVGLGVTEPGNAAIFGGSFWQQVVNLPAGRTDPEMMVRVNPHAVAPLAQAECISFFVGLTMRWFRDTFCEAQIAEAARRGVDPYQVLEEQAAQVPAGANGIIPVFSDAMNFAAWYHAAPSFLNMSIEPSHTTPASLFRALEENAAIVSAENLRRVIAFSDTDIGDLVTFAGGASKGALWAQILADVLQRDIAIPVVREATALGCAAVAAVGAGQFSDMQEAGKAFSRVETVVKPNRNNAALYADAAERWRKAYMPQRALVDTGVTTSMWKAPGL
ncbi:autoinducer-2 kinase [Halovulum dunhuangense]|uniref:Autoinducer-2 kinase n=1 Tax=Halovulum dunhuangense TaxID=1505036 RepID=A0A849L0U0_9RHOB|nr:autoinducer-2 kinase [Halovulum dunhuangense]NNU79881.1 autoinducer-2 kinase [Halovulum dunhuangense]